MFFSLLGFKQLASALLSYFSRFLIDGGCKRDAFELRLLLKLQLFFLLQLTHMVGLGFIVKSLAWLRAFA